MNEFASCYAQLNLENPNIDMLYGNSTQSHTQGLIKGTKTQSKAPSQKANQTSLAASKKTTRQAFPRRLSPSWLRGPINESGSLCDICDQPIVCMSVNPNVDEFVVGSTDHALYVYEMETCTKSRQLYSRDYGHTEWVTCVEYLSDGRVY